MTSSSTYNTSVGTEFSVVKENALINAGASLGVASSAFFSHYIELITLFLFCEIFCRMMGLKLIFCIRDRRKTVRMKQGLAHRDKSTILILLFFLCATISLALLVLSEMSR